MITQKSLLPVPSMMRGCSIGGNQPLFKQMSKFNSHKSKGSRKSSSTIGMQRKQSQILKDSDKNDGHDMVAGFDLFPKSDDDESPQPRDMYNQEYNSAAYPTFQNMQPASNYDPQK